jgi:hypothetical protein
MMTGKMAGVASLAAAFVAGMLVATALIGGTSGAAAQSQQFCVQRNFVGPTPATRTATTPAAQQSATQQQQVIVQKGVITPTVTDEDIELLRHDLRDRKRQVIGENMSLSDEEGEKFWPIYQHYVRDLTAVNDQKYALLKQYAEMWETMSDQDALIYVRHWLEVDGQAQALRLKYVPVVSQVLPGRKAATFFQLDRRLNMIVDLQLFGQIPLAHVKN